jgi:hypothetical protein
MICTNNALPITNTQNNGLVNSIFAKIAIIPIKIPSKIENNEYIYSPFNQLLAIGLAGFEPAMAGHELFHLHKNRMP